MNESGVFFLFALFFAVIRIAIALHQEANPLPPVPKLRPWAEPRPDESTDAYYNRMEGFRQLEDLSEKEGHGGC